MRNSVSFQIICGYSFVSVSTRVVTTHAYSFHDESEAPTPSLHSKDGIRCQKAQWRMR